MPWLAVIFCTGTNVFIIFLTNRQYFMPLMVFFAGEVRRKGILYQYNEEIEGTKKDSFTLQGEGTYR
jgi:hypothetical protein